MAGANEVRKQTAQIRAEQRKRNEAAAAELEAQTAAAEEFASLPRHERRQRELELQRQQAERNEGVKAAPGAPENKAMPGPAENKADLDSMSKAELYEIAQERDIEGRSDMTKAELLKALS